MEAKRPVQSIIARLMGLDELQSQQPVKKRPRVLSENYLRRVASIGTREKCAERYPFRLETEEKNGYKSLFQVSETLKRGRHRGSSVEKGGSQISSSSSEVKLKFKRRDVKHVPVNKKLRSSEEDDYGVLEIIGSERNDWLRHPRGPYLLASQKFSFPDTISKSLHSCGYREIGESRYCLLTTGIAVLKRKLGKAEDPGRCFSSSAGSHVASCPGVREGNGVHTVQDKSLFVEMKRRKKLSNGVESGRQRSRFSKEVVRKTGHGINNMSAEAPRSKNGSQNTIAKDSNLMIRFEPSLSERKSSYYVMNECTKNFQSVELAYRNEDTPDGCDIPFHESSLVNLDCEPSKSDLRNQVSPESGTGKSHTPVSKGWIDSKNRHGRNIVKPRSLLAELNAYGSTNAKTRDHSLQNGNLDSGRKDGSESGNTDSICNIPPSNSCSQSQKSHSKQATYVIQNDPEGKEEDPHDKRMGTSMPWERRGPNLQDSWVIQEEDKKQGIDRNLPSVLDLSFQQDISNGNSEADTSYCSHDDQDSESILSLEHAYPSPDSVLEQPDGEEIFSSTDYSGSAYLRGLHMHIELLKSGTDTFLKGSGMMIPGDEDNGKDSGVDSGESENQKRSFGIEDSREFFYLVDVLKEAGFYSRNLHASSDVWPSKQYPLSCTIFEKLEKKYGDDIPWNRSERKLLFDRINSGMTEISQPLVGIPVWRNSVARRLLFGLNQDLFAEELWKLLVTQEKEASTGCKKFRRKEDDWSETRDDIQIIGREIENSLLDELVEEVVMDTF